MPEFDIIEVEKEEDMQIIIGHAGFIKTAEDLYESMQESVPGIKFGVAFIEASGKRLVRTEGNDPKLESLAAKNSLKINTGHTFIILFTGAYPINVLKHVKDTNEVVSIYCATANPIKLVVAKNGPYERAIIGVIDGQSAVGIENNEDKKERHDFLRKIGYKK